MSFEFAEKLCFSRKLLGTVLSQAACVLDFLLRKPVTHCAKALVRFGFRNPGLARPQTRYPAPSLTLTHLMLGLKNLKKLSFFGFFRTLNCLKQNHIFVSHITVGKREL